MFRTLPRRVSLPNELTQPSLVLASLNEKNVPATVPMAGRNKRYNRQPRRRRPWRRNSRFQRKQRPASGHYTGEPISVNLKDVDLKDFFRLIHEISGLNVVLDPNVKGTLTIVLDEVPWDQALDIVLQNNGLDKQLTGNVLRVATRETLKKEAETMRDLEKRKPKQLLR